MVGPELPNTSQKTIDLAYQIDKFVETGHQFAKGITEKTLKRVKFVIERYTQKSDEPDEPASRQQRVGSRSQTPSLQFPPDWAIDRASLRAAIREFDSSTEGLHLGSFNMADGSSASVNLTKSDVQQMIDAAAQWMIDAAVQQAITAALQAQKTTAPQSPESQSQLSPAKDDNHITIPAWKTEDLGYFQSNLADKNDGHTVMVGSQTHY